MRMNVTERGIDWFRLTPDQLAELEADVQDAATIEHTATKYADGSIIEHDPADTIRRDGSRCHSVYCPGDYVTADGRAICTKRALDRLQRVAQRWHGGPMAQALDATNAAKFAAHVTTGGATS